MRWRQSERSATAELEPNLSLYACPDIFCWHCLANRRGNCAGGASSFFGGAKARYLSEAPAHSFPSFGRAWLVTSVQPHRAIGGEESYD